MVKPKVKISIRNKDGIVTISALLSVNDKCVHCESFEYQQRRWDSKSEFWKRGVINRLIAYSIDVAEINN